MAFSMSNPLIGNESVPILLLPKRTPAVCEIPFVSIPNAIWSIGSACIGGGAAAILAGHPELLALKNQVGCGMGSGGSSSSAFSSSSSGGSDPV